MSDRMTVAARSVRFPETKAMRFHALIVAAAVSVVTVALAAPSPGAGPSRRIEPEPVMTFRAKGTAAVLALEIVAASPAWAAARRAAVSDLVVRLRPAGEGRLQTVLSLADGDRPGRNRTLFTAELLVVANGRVLIEERAVCGAWASSASICRAECDGGTFAIVRKDSVGGRTLVLRVGRVDAAEGVGVRIGACTDGAGEEVSLAPSRGSATAEIELRPE